MSDFARLARQNLGARRTSCSPRCASRSRSTSRWSAASVPPLDTFAVAVAAAITLLFVTVLLVSGSLALEREENTFTRLTRGLVSREGLLVEKVVLGTGARAGGDAADAARDHALRVDRLEPDLPDRPRDPAGGCRLLGDWASRSARPPSEVRASALLAFALALPVAFISLVPSGTVSKTLST